MKKLEYGDGLNITVIITNSGHFKGIYYMPPEGDIRWHKNNGETGRTESEREAYLAIKAISTAKHWKAT